MMDFLGFNGGLDLIVTYEHYKLTLKRLVLSESKF